jgi:uncharacterized membrane protein
MWIRIGAVLLFPGLLCAWALSHWFSIAAGVIAGGLTNGALYGLVLYGWYRLADVLRIPAWSARLVLKCKR